MIRTAHIGKALIFALLLGGSGVVVAADEVPSGEADVLECSVERPYSDEQQEALDRVLGRKLSDSRWIRSDLNIVSDFLMRGAENSPNNEVQKALAEVRSVFGRINRKEEAQQNTQDINALTAAVRKLHGALEASSAAGAFGAGAAAGTHANAGPSQKPESHLVRNLGLTGAALLVAASIYAWARTGSEPDKHLDSEPVKHLEEESDTQEAK